MSWPRLAVWKRKITHMEPGSWMPEIVMEGHTMAKRTNQYHILYPLGVTLTENGAEILVQADAKELNLLLFHAGEPLLLRR